MQPRMQTAEALARGRFLARQEAAVPGFFPGLAGRG